MCQINQIEDPEIHIESNKILTNTKLYIRDNPVSWTNNGDNRTSTSTGRRIKQISHFSSCMKIISKIDQTL